MDEEDRKADLEFEKSREKFLNKDMVKIFKKKKPKADEQKKYLKSLNQQHRYGYNQPTNNYRP